MDDRSAAGLRGSIISLLTAAFAAIILLGGAPASALVEPEPDPPDPEVISVQDVCQPGDRAELTLVLGAGHRYDVTVGGTPAEHLDGPEFDTRELVEPGTFVVHLGAIRTGQQDVVAVGHQGTHLHVQTIDTGACYVPKTTSLTLTALSSVMYGTTVTLTGQLSSGDAPVSGASLVVERRFVGATPWTSHAVVKTSATGAFSATATPSKHTEYRVRFAGSDTHGASTSLLRRVTVKQHSTTQSISRSAGTITYGASVTISGNLRTTAGAAVAGEKVSLQRRFAGTTTWTTHATAATSSTGRVAFSVAPSRKTEYRLRHAATTGYAAATSTSTTVNVRPKLTFSASQQKALLGRTTTIKGKLSPTHSAQKVQLQRLQSGSWKTVTTAKPSSTGAYSFAVKPSGTGTSTYRVRVPSTTRHVSVTSPTAKLIRYKAIISTINYDAPGNDWNNLNGEYVVVKNTGSNTVNLQGWVIDADDGQKRNLPSYSLGAGKTVRLHTGSGSNGGGRIYLGFKMPIWNNSGGDTGRLYDPNGVLASTYKY